MAYAVNQRCRRRVLRDINVILKIIEASVSRDKLQNKSVKDIQGHYT